MAQMQISALFNPAVQNYQTKLQAIQRGNAAARIASIGALLAGGTPDASRETRARIVSLARWRNVGLAVAVLFGGLCGFCVYRRLKLPGGNPFQRSWVTHKNVLWWTLGAFASGAVSAVGGGLALTRQLKKGRYLDLEDSKGLRKAREQAARLPFSEFREWVSHKNMVRFGVDLSIDSQRMIQYDLFNVGAAPNAAEKYCKLGDLWECSEVGARAYQGEVDGAHREHFNNTRQIETVHQQHATLIEQRRVGAEYARSRASHDVAMGSHMIQRGQQSDGAVGKVLNYGVGGLSLADGAYRGVNASIESHRAAAAAREEQTQYNHLRRPHDERREGRLSTAAADYGAFRAFVNGELRPILVS